MSTTETAEEIIEALREHVGVLVGRKWPEISRILDKDGEISISAKISVTKREPELGEHADKDDRVKTTISFAEKFTDSTESALEDPAQPELPLEERESAEDVEEQEEPEAQETGLPKLPFIANELSLSDAVHFGKEFKRAAKAAGWTKEQTDEVAAKLKACDSIVAMLETLKPHIAE